MSRQQRYKLVAAVYINSRGFAFVLFEGSLAPLDWGVSEIRGKDKQSRILLRVSALLARYAPDVLVLQDTSQGGTRRTHRIRHLNDAIAELADDHGVPVLSYSRAEVYRAFDYLDKVTKDRIAAAIAKHIPAFERFLPPVRKPWMSEDARMGLFDAAALVLTLFHSQEGSG